MTKYFIIFITCFFLFACSNKDILIDQDSHTSSWKEMNISSTWTISGEILIKRIIPVGTDIEYDNIFEQFDDVAQKYQDARERQDYTFSRQKQDADIIEKNKNTFIRLFQENKLPILHTLKIGDKKVFISAPYGNHPVEMYPEWYVSCWFYFSPWGSSTHNICMAFTDSIDTKLTTEMVFSSSNVNYNIIATGSFFINHYSDGDMCASWGNYALFDENLVTIRNLNYVNSSCNFVRTSFSKNGYTIEFLDSHAENPFATSSWVYIPRASHMRILSGSLFTERVLYEYVSHRVWFTFDPIENTLNGDTFDFTFWWKNFSLTRKDIESFAPSFITDANKLRYQFTLSGEEWIDEEIYGRLMWSITTPENNRYYDIISNISVLSCQKNSSQYDDEPYTLLTYTWGEVFRYKIDTKFWNKCPIPYNFSFKSSSGNTFNTAVKIVR